jgi:arylsulfatase A-like enzyme
MRRQGSEPPLKIEKAHPLRMSEWSGNHTLHGILFARGKGIKKGVRYDGARLIDMAPTILTLLGLPVSADMDGRVLSEILTEPYQAAQPTATPTPSSNPPPSDDGQRREGDGYSAEEAALVEERLKNLGYLEE